MPVCVVRSLFVSRSLLLYNNGIGFLDNINEAAMIQTKAAFIQIVGEKHLSTES